MINKKNISLFSSILLLFIFLLFFSCSSNNYYVYRNNLKFNNENKKSDDQENDEENSIKSNSSYDTYNTEIKNNNNKNYDSKNIIKIKKNRIPENLVIPDYTPRLIFSISNKKTYIIKKGDTLYSISKHYNVSVEKIKEINKIKNPNKIKPGQKLIIPGLTFNFYSLSDKYSLNFKTNNILEYKFLNSNIIFSPLEKGKINYIGKIRGYGLSIIINSNNFYVILSGFKNIFINQGDIISLKSPLGSISNTKILYISIFQNNNIINLEKIIKIK